MHVGLGACVYVCVCACLAYRCVETGRIKQNRNFIHALQEFK